MPVVMLSDKAGPFRRTVRDKDGKAVSPKVVLRFDVGVPVEIADSQMLSIQRDLENGSLVMSPILEVEAEETKPEPAAAEEPAAAPALPPTITTQPQQHHRKHRH